MDLFDGRTTILLIQHFTRRSDIKFLFSTTTEIGEPALSSMVEHDTQSFHG